MTRMLEDNKLIVGWREWGSLPALDIPAIKIKIDTGAKTSTLHALDIEIMIRDQKRYAQFCVYPLQNNSSILRQCILPVLDERIIKSSNGHEEQRITVLTPIRIAEKQWDIELTLTDRSTMFFNMLLGRQAMKNLLVDPTKSFCQGRITSRRLEEIYSVALGAE